MNHTAKFEEFFIGTYTSPGGSKGIYYSTLNPETGELSKPTLAAPAESPSYVALSPNRKHLYAVLESTDGDVNAYDIGPNGALTLLNTEKSSGAGACHLSVDHSGKWLFTASYNSGRYAALPIKEDGSLGIRTFDVQNRGTGPDKSRQEGPHLHSIYQAPSANIVYALDLGADDILINEFNPQKGQLLPTIPGVQKSPAGGGPRHMAFHPSKKIAYVNNEMGNSVSVYAMKDSGALEELQTISTTPDGVPHNDNTTAEIMVHPSGKWLYVSNRGLDSIAIYNIQTDGTLKLMEIEMLAVAKVPRGFDIDATGKWLVVGGQATNTVQSLKINQATGRLQQTQNRITVDKPVCILFRRP